MDFVSEQQLDCLKYAAGSDKLVQMVYERTLLMDRCTEARSCPWSLRSDLLRVREGRNA